MKKNLLSIVLFAVIMVTNTYAHDIDDNVDQKVLVAFNQKFSTAGEVSWSKSEHYSKASFTWSGQIMYAYFSESGELLGTSRNVVFHQIPINLQNGLKKQLRNGWLTDLYEFATDDQSTYYATVENAAGKTILVSSGTSSWEVYKKVKK